MKNHDEYRPIELGERKQHIAVAFLSKKTFRLFIMIKLHANEASFSS